MAIIFRHYAADGTLDLNTTQKVVGILAFVWLLGFLAVAASAAAIYQMATGKILEPTDNWITVLNSVLLFIASVLGLAGAVTVGKRATAKAEMVEVMARQISGVSSTSGHDKEGETRPRASQPVAVPVGLLADRVMNDIRMTDKPPETGDAVDEKEIP